MDMLPMSISLVLILTLTIAVITDLRTKKIYNWLTFPAIGLGLLLHSLQHGLQGLGFALSGIGVASLALLLFLLLGAMGAGDVKLLWAVGALMGPAFMLRTLVATAIIGMVMGLGYALRKGSLAYTIQNTIAGGHVVALTGEAGDLQGMAARSRAGRMPYAPAIALGAAIACWLLQQGLF